MWVRQSGPRYGQERTNRGGSGGEYVGSSTRVQVNFYLIDGTAPPPESQETSLTREPGTAIDQRPPLRPRRSPVAVPTAHTGEGKGGEVGSGYAR